MDFDFSTNRYKNDQVIEMGALGSGILGPELSLMPCFHTYDLSTRNHLEVVLLVALMLNA